jgi:ATP-dependent DNA ligase
MPEKKATASFIEPMLLQRTAKLPEGPDWLIELKLDGYRALAIKSGGTVQLQSRNDNNFNSRYPGIVKALAPMPDETVIDGEVVALDEDGRPSFNTLQNYGAAGAPLHFFIFDLLMLRGREVINEPLVKRRELIEKHVLPALAEPIRFSPILEANLLDLIRSVKAQGLEGLVAKRRAASMSRACAPVLGRKCASIRRRSLSSPDTRRHSRISTRWSSDTTKATGWSTPRGPGMASRLRRERSCSRSLSRWK